MTGTALAYAAMDSPSDASRTRALSAGRLSAVLVAAGFLALALLAAWGSVDGTTIGLPRVVTAMVLVLLGLLASMLAWRTMLSGLGGQLAPREAARVFFLGQLGKYVPGSVWAVAGQVEAGTRYSLPRAATAASAMSVMVVNVVTGLLLGGLGVLLGLVDAEVAGGWIIVALAAAAVAGAVLLSPPVFGRLVRRAALLLRRQAPARTPDAVHLGRAGGWTMLMWGCYGGQILLLSGQPPGARMLALATAAFAAAWSVGFLAVIAPAGAGVREVVLGLLLAPVIGGAAATSAALMSRAIMTAGDGLLAAGAIGLERGRRR